MNAREMFTDLIDLTYVDKFSHGFNITNDGLKNIYADKFSRINSSVPFTHTQLFFVWINFGKLVKTS